MAEVQIRDFMLDLDLVNPNAFKSAKALCKFGHSECNRVNISTFDELSYNGKYA